MDSVLAVHLLQSLSLLHNVQLGSFFAPSVSIIPDGDGGGGGGAKDDAIILIENRLRRRKKKRVQVRSPSLSLIPSFTLERPFGSTANKGKAKYDDLVFSRRGGE